jgi:hypothetical protein
LFGDKKEGAWKIRQKGKLEVPAVGSSDLKKGCQTMNIGIISLGVGRLLSYTPFDAAPSESQSFCQVRAVCRGEVVCGVGEADCGDSGEKLGIEASDFIIF